MKKVFIILIVFLQSSILFSQKENQVMYNYVQQSHRLTSPFSVANFGNVLQADRELTLYDSPSQTSICFTNTIEKAELKLTYKYGLDDYENGISNYSSSIRVEIKAYDAQSPNTELAGSPIYFDLKIESNSTMIYNPESICIKDITSQINTISPANAIYRITSISNLSGTIFNDMFLDAELIIDRKIKKLTNNIEIDLLNPSKTEYHYIPFSYPHIYFEWEFLNSGDCVDEETPMFEIQLLRLFNKDESNDDNIKNLYTKIHWDEALSFFVSGTINNNGKYRDTLSVVDGTGYYIWRIRAITDYYRNFSKQFGDEKGGIADHRNWGDWNYPKYDNGTSINDLLDGYELEILDDVINLEGGFFYYQFDGNINWKYERIFTEGNNKSKVLEKIAYADNLLNIRQNQKYIKSDKTKIVSQSIYDYVGRQAINTLPVPFDSELTGNLGYSQGLAYAGTDNLYSYEDFDNGTTSTSNYYSPSSMSGSDVDNYYSGTSSTSPIISEERVPSSSINNTSSNYYPYSRTVYENNQLSEVKEISGFGEQFAIGSTVTGENRTTKIFRSEASEDELISVFGNETPRDNGIYKVINKDPNGVYSVNYYNSQNKLIASALKNSASDNINLLPLETINSENPIVKEDLNTRSITHKFNDPKIIDDGYFQEKRLHFTDATTITIDHILSQNYFEENCFSGCLTCKYYVEIDIINVETMQRPTTSSQGCGALPFVLDNFDFQILENGCENNSTTTTCEFILDPGTYIVRKKMTAYSKTNTESGIINEIENEVVSTIYNDLVQAFSNVNLLSSLESIISGQVKLTDFYNTFDQLIQLEPQKWSDEGDVYKYTSENCCEIEFEKYECEKCNDMLDNGNYQQYLIEEINNYLLEQGIDANHLPRQPNDLYESLADGTNNTIIETYNVFPYFYRSDYINASGQGLNNLYPKEQGDPNSIVGHFDKMIYNMSLEPNNKFQEEELCDCWTSSVSALKYGGIKLDPAISPGYSFDEDFDLLDAFLTCVDKKYDATDTDYDICYEGYTDHAFYLSTAISPRPTEGYLDHAYKYFYSDPDNQGPVTQGCLARLNIFKDPNNKWQLLDENNNILVDACDGIDPNSTTPDEPYFSLYHCIRNKIDDNEAEDLAADKGITGICDKTFDDLKNSNITAQELEECYEDRCNDECDSKFNMFVDRLIKLYNDDEKSVQGQPFYQNGATKDFEDPNDDGDWDIIERFRMEYITSTNYKGHTISIEEIYCMASALVENCKVACDVTIDTLNNSMTVHPDYEKVFTHDYEISLTTGTGFSTVGPPTEFQRSKWDSYVEDQLNELLSNYIVYNPFIPASNEEYEALGSNVTDPSIKYSGGLTRNYHYSNYDCCMDNLNYKITFWKDPYNETSYLGLPYHTGPNADKGLQYYNANLFFSLINELFNEQFDNDDMICIPPVSDVVMCKGGDDTQLSLKALYYRPNCQVCPKEDGKINALSDLQYGYYIFTGNVDMYSRYQSFIQPLTVIQDNISFNRFVVDEEDLGITTIPTVLSVNSSTFDYPLENDCDNNIVISCNNTVYFKWITKEIIVDNSIPEKNVKKTCDQIMAGQLKEKLYNDIAVCASETAQSVVSNYKENCTTPLIDDFSVSYSGPDYYHYTLYYYDRAGNLVRTVPPIGVEVNNLADRNTQMNHTFDSEYQYDTKNSVLSEKVPDRVFPSKYVYNYKDQLVFSYDARQFDKLTDPAEQAHFFSYTKYDDLGRVIETGEAKVDMNDLMSKATTVPFAINEVNRYLEYFAKDETRLTTFLSTLNKKMYIKTVYGELVSTSLELNLNPEFPNQGRNLENRVNYIYRDADGDDLTIDDKVKTFYSYDLHGNVEWIMNEIAPAGDYYYPSSRLVGITHYNYDLISGNVNKISYNPGRHDSYYHRYTYDEDQRLKMVETSRYGEIWDRDTRYEYYKHGPLKRTLVGEDKIQGIDYTYTINGWLKGINHSSLNGTSSLDPSEDGMTGGDTDIAPDGFGMVLNYFNNDYYNSGTINFNNAQTENVNFGTQLYNGNIGAWAMSEYNPNILTSKVDPPTLSTSYKYTYDVLNRIKSSTEFNFSGGVWTTLLSGDYSTNYSYDPNGNITNLIRNTFATGGNAAMDNLSYNYSYNATSPANNNKLLSVDESIPDGFASLGDIRMTNNNTNDYSYDASGNLTEDERSGIASIDWTADGKIERINYNNASKYIEFLYDGLGNRVRKLIYNKDYYYDEPQQMYYDSYQMTYYMREANSNVMAVYGRTTQQPLATRGQFNYCIEYNDGVSHSGQFCVFSDNMISFSYGKLKTFFTINPITNGSGGSYVQGSGDTVIVDLTTRTLYVHIQGIDYEYNITQFYSYDLNNGGLELTEWHLWGNGTEGRIAVRKPEKVIFYEENLAQNPIPTENFTRDIRRKHYEFKDHLGNVRITYSDLKNMVAANDFALDLINTTGYYPFGMQMSARTFTNTDAIFADGGHRYGFNGMEKDDEIKGDGNSLNYGNRLYSPRIAKFFKLDPFTARFPWMSPFQYAHNMPIIAIDLEGLHPDFKIDMNINMNTVMKLADKNASDTEIMKAYNRLHYQGSPKSIEELHSMLDAVGFIPVIGEPADALNALIYTFQGDYLNAGISAAAIIPVIGEAGKIIKHTVRYFRSVNQANKYRKYLIHGQRVADAIWDSGKSGKNLLRDNMKKLGVNLNKKQAHHLIPVELAEKNSTVKEAINQGFDFNGIVNGVPLDVTRHSGSHPQYTALVSDFISDIQKANPKLSSKEVVEKAAARARKYIETTTGKLK